MEGSPTIQTLISPRRWIPSWVCLCTPPISCSRIPFLTISCPDYQYITHNRRGVLTVNSRSNTGYQSLIDIVGLHHSPQLVNFLLGQRLQERILILNSIFRITPNISRPSLLSAYITKERKDVPWNRQTSRDKPGKQSCTVNP